MSISTPVSLIATGGTIACTTDAAGALVPTLSAEELCASAGLIPGNLPGEVTVRDTLHTDSSEMGLSDLDRLLVAVAAAVRQGPVVVTHGTDSMEETAMAVDRLIGGPVVITGPPNTAPANQRTDNWPNGSNRGPASTRSTKPAKSRTLRT
uniref:asparaginase domain-containing protein n=1 Tax=Corynebacterium provencense TaxID=1737425 RepID=UPI000ABBAD0A